MHTYESIRLRPSLNISARRRRRRMTVWVLVPLFLYPGKNASIRLSRGAAGCPASFTCSSGLLLQLAQMEAPSAVLHQLYHPRHQFLKPSTPFASRQGLRTAKINEPYIGFYDVRMTKSYCVFFRVATRATWTRTSAARCVTCPSPQQWWHSHTTRVKSTPRD